MVCRKFGIEQLPKSMEMMSATHKIHHSKEYIKDLVKIL